MLANYHTHTARCKHAVGADEEYVEAAIAEGLTILGFSDHPPMPFHGGYESYYKMSMGELDGYVESVLSLREKYKDKIKIHLGFETEFYPTMHARSLEVWRCYPVDYLILGQHFVGEEFDGEKDPAPRPSDDKRRVTKYVDLVISAMQTGLFSFIAHPDLINYTGEDMDFYYREMGRLIEAAKAHGLPLEYNLLGMSGGRSYPRREFWEEAARRGATAIIGCDAHEPWRVAKADELEGARAFLDSLGIYVVDETELVSIGASGTRK